MIIQPHSQTYLHFSTQESEIRSKDWFSKHWSALPHLLSQDAHAQEQFDDFSNAHSRRWKVEFRLHRPGVPQCHRVRGSNQGHYRQAVQLEQ